MSRVAIGLFAGLLAIPAHPAFAGNLVDLRVIDRDSGQQLPEYRHRGETWIPGTPSHRYSVELVNTSDERMLVVLSVDGVNAVSGETAATWQSGYVLEPGESATIDGWRKSMQRVAQFVFTDVPDSYAARTGRPDNIGVIGAAVFRERYPVPMYRGPRITGSRGSERNRMPPAPITPTADAATAPAAAEMRSESRAVANKQSIGTGHGASQWSPVDTTTFRRASSSPAEVVSLRYDDMASLRQRGVVPDWRPAPRRPEPFPAGFVPDPPRRW